MWYYINVLRKDIKILNSSSVMRRWRKRPSYLIRHTSRDGTGYTTKYGKSLCVSPHAQTQKTDSYQSLTIQTNSIISLASLSRGNFTLFQNSHISNGITTFKQSLTRTQNSPASAVTRYHKSRVPWKPNTVGKVQLFHYPAKGSLVYTDRIQFNPVFTSIQKVSQPTENTYSVTW